MNYLVLPFLTLFSLGIAAQALPEETAQALPEETAQALQEETAAQEQVTAAEFMLSLQPQSGKITLPDNIATLDLSAGFQYLSPESAERLLVDAWGNPPGNETLGMIIPADVSPLEVDGWGVVITYSEDGYVSDKDADQINYDDLLADMQAQSKEANEERKNQGYGSLLLVGWAEPPHYDKAAHKYYWAKEFATDDSEENSLNYNIRILGRQGVLDLNAVAGMNQMAKIKQRMPELIAATEFTSGHRYEDFNASTDKVAEYGLAALVAGGVAAKMGLFAKIGAFLLAFKKFIIIGVVALVGLLGKLLSRKR